MVFNGLPGGYRHVHAAICDGRLLHPKALKVKWSIDFGTSHARAQGDWITHYCSKLTATMAAERLA
jgi:hypothetical protein